MLAVHPARLCLPACLQVFVEGTRAAVEAATAAASAPTNGNGLTNGTAKIDASFVVNSLAAESAASAAAAAAEAAEATGTTTKKRGRKPTKKKEEKEKPGEPLAGMILSGGRAAGAELQGVVLGQPGRVSEPLSGEQGCLWMQPPSVVTLLIFPARQPILPAALLLLPWRRL